MNRETEKPLVFFDLETTGTNTEKDRVVQFAAIRLPSHVVNALLEGTVIYAEQEGEKLEMLVNPGIRIPAEASFIHGITDADVKDKPTFKEQADAISEFIGDGDLAGFNITGFDIPMLIAEFNRAGKDFDISERRVIDAMEIFHRKMPRNLATAVHFYCGYELVDAHNALADVMGTIDVLESQIGMYLDIPHDIDGLSEWCRGEKVTLDGKIVWDERGEACLNFGKHRGSTLRSIFENNRGYLAWMVDQSFPCETLGVIDNALQGKFPERSAR